MLTENISGMPAVARNYITILLIFVDATPATVSEELVTD